MQGYKGEFLGGPENNLFRDTGEVYRNHGGDPGELGVDIAGGGAVDGVVGCGVEAQVSCYGFGVQPQGRARERPGAVGGYSGALVPVQQTVKIAGQGPGMGQELVGEQDRLGVLQVGAARHGRVGVGLGLGNQGVDGVHDAGSNDRGVIAQVHAAQGGNLVVAGAASTQLTAQFDPGTFDEALFEGAVHILIRLSRSVGARTDVSFKLVKGCNHAGELVVGE